jgi:CHASE3 domain sensor protein
VNFFYRNLSNKQLVILGLAVPLLCTLLIGWLQWHSVSDMLKTRELVRHTRAVQLALGVFRYSLSDAESCQFRYILTDNDVNLKLYNKLLASASDQFKLLRSLTSDNAAQQKELDRIEPLLSEKVRVTAQSLALEQSGDRAGALRLAGAEESRLNMLEIENDVEDMQATEAKLLFLRQNIYQHNFKVAGLLSVMSMTLSLCFIIGILLLLRRLAQLQSFVTLCALTEMIEYEGGMMTIEEYLKRRHQALATHGAAQVEAERILGLLKKRNLRPTVAD